MFEDTIGIIRSSKSKGRKYNGEKKNVKRQSVQHKILHRKLFCACTVVLFVFCFCLYCCFFLSYVPVLLQPFIQRSLRTYNTIRNIFIPPFQPFTLESLWTWEVNGHIICNETSVTENHVSGDKLWKRKEGWDCEYDKRNIYVVFCDRCFVAYYMTVDFPSSKRF
jgi:hypothetical protein